MAIPNTDTQRQMRLELVAELERFREEAARLRAEIGDIDVATAQFAREHVDPEMVSEWRRGSGYDRRHGGSETEDDWLDGW